MKEKQDKTTKINDEMSFFGVGPTMTIILIPFIVLFSALNALFYPLFQIPIHQVWMLILGIFLIIIGIYIFIKSVKVIKKAYYASELATTGFYGHMRNPLYGSVTLFIFPGIACLFNSWIFFLIPIVFYIIFKIFIRREEIYCLKKFGEKYAHYKQNVHAIFPKLKKYRPNKN